MSEHTTTECLLFPDIFDRPVVAKFDQRQGSSDGGAILLQAAERRLGLTSALAGCLRDDRQPGKVQHELRELITQRVMAIALGYEDANDAARLASDPIHKLLVGRDPVDGEDLASQPTLSRFENTPNRKEMLRMTEALADRVLERHRKRLHGRARRITIDMDPTDDPTHGQQEFSFFNRHYDSYCYLPMVCFFTFNEEAEQYLVAAVLRPGNATGSVGALGILRRLIDRVSNAFPKARIRVRLDGGFASPEVLDFLDCEPKVEYLVNLAANAVLKRKAESAMKRARRASKTSDQTEHVYGECRYATRETWPWKRRVIYKAETVLAAGVTNTAVLEKFALDPKSMPMKPMSVEQCVSEGLSGLVKNRSRIVPGRLDRILNALVPASLARKMLSDLLSKGVASKSPVASARGEA